MSIAKKLKYDTEIEKFNRLSERMECLHAYYR